MHGKRFAVKEKVESRNLRERVAGEEGDRTVKLTLDDRRAVAVVNEASVVRRRLAARSERLPHHRHRLLVRNGVTLAADGVAADVKSLLGGEDAVREEVIVENVGGAEKFDGEEGGGAFGELGRGAVRCERGGELKKRNGRNRTYDPR
jgi:hypothetical protein